MLEEKDILGKCHKKFRLKAENEWGHQRKARETDWKISKNGEKQAVSWTKFWTDQRVHQKRVKVRAVNILEQTWNKLNSFQAKK